MHRARRALSIVCLATAVLALGVWFASIWWGLRIWHSRGTLELGGGAVVYFPRPVIFPDSAFEPGIRLVEFCKTGIPFTFWAWSFGDPVIAFPLWPLGLVLAIGGWLARPRGRAGPGCCRSCGYDLRASPERCPECGMAVAETTIAEQG